MACNEFGKLETGDEEGATAVTDSKSGPGVLEQCENDINADWGWKRRGIMWIDDAQGPPAASTMEESVGDGAMVSALDRTWVL
jgi:hypothetical protein